MRLLFERDYASFLTCIVFFGMSVLILLFGIIFYFLKSHKWNSIESITYCGIIITAVLACFIPSLNRYADVHGRLEESIYQEAEGSRKEYHFNRARELYELIPDYKDSVDKAYECTLYSANYYIETGLFTKAMGHLHQCRDSEKTVAIPNKKLSGKKLFEEAQEMLKQVNFQNGLSLIECYASEWTSEDKSYYLNFIEKGDSISLSTNLYRNNFGLLSILKKFNYYNDGGIIMTGEEGKDNNTPRFALQYGTDTSTLNAYIYENGSILSLVKQ